MILVIHDLFRLLGPLIWILLLLHSSNSLLQFPLFDFDLLLSILIGNILSSKINIRIIILLSIC